MRFSLISGRGYGEKLGRTLSGGGGGGGGISIYNMYVSTHTHVMMFCVMPILCM